MQDKIVKKFKKYSAEDLQSALNLIRLEGKSIRSVAQIFKIPRATLQMHLQKKTSFYNIRSEQCV